MGMSTATMKSRTLGTQGLVVSEIGPGCMGMSEFYGATDDAEPLADAEMRRVNR